MLLPYYSAVEQTPQSESKTAFLGTNDIFPLLLKMSIPAAIGMIVNALYNVVDAIFVGHGVGSLAIAALSIVFPIQMIVSALAMGISVGTASIVSRRLGERRERDAARAIGSAYSFITAATAVLVVLVIAFMRPLLGFFGASEAIMPYAVGYLRTIAPGFFFFSISLAASNLVRAEGNASASMTGMMLGAGINIVLDPVMIFVLGMGVRGAALATVMSQLSSSVFFFSLYLRKRTHVHIEPADFVIRPALLRESTLLGIPAFVQAAGMSLLALIVNTTVGAYGGDQAISIYGMTMRLSMLVIFPILGVAQGFQPIVGYNYGARRYDRVHRTIWVTIGTVLGFSFAIYAVIMSFPAACMSLFASDPNLVTAAARVIRIFAFFIPLAAVQIVGANYFLAVGKKYESVVLGLSRQFFFLIPLILVLPRYLGLDGVWYSFPVADLLSTSLTTTLLILEVRHLDRIHTEEMVAAEARR